MLIGSLVIVRADIAQRRAQFLADAQIAHRLLSQQAAQHEAILATLSLLNPAGPDRSPPALRLTAVYPQLLRVLVREAGGVWPDDALRAAEEQSRIASRPQIAWVDAREGRYALVQAGPAAAFALVIDAAQMIPWREWPIGKGGPVSVSLALGGQSIVLQPGPEPAARPAGLTPGFVFAMPLATASQPFELRLRLATGPAQWPWVWWAVWTLLVSVAIAWAAAGWSARRARRRAEELLRLGQVARLNAMGEIAAGIAHELNQPLSAVLANAQAARRLLDDEPPALAVARHAMTQASEQARRAADVLGRLRRRLQAPGAAAATQPLRLDNSARQVLDLLEPQIRQCGVQAVIEGGAVLVQADPVALEQIVHNLVNNAMAALELVPGPQRRLVLQIVTQDNQGVLIVRDSGPGFPPDILPRLFEPFYSTREGGLGLGLSLSETLAQAMNGTLSAHHAEPRGAAFRLALPLSKEDGE